MIKICRVALAQHVKVIKQYKSLKKDQLFLCKGFGYDKEKKAYRILKELRTLEQKEIRVFNETLDYLWENGYIKTVSIK